MPSWGRTLRLADVFHNEDLSFIERRDVIVQRIRRAPFWDTDDAVLVDVVDELAEADEPDYFDDVWDIFYDWADAARVWVATV